MTDTNSSYNSQKQLESVVAGNSNPLFSSIDTLASLRQLNYFKTSPDIDPDIAKIAESETLFLSQSMKAIAQSPLLASKFGSGMSGAVGLASILKDKYSEARFNESIVDFIPPAEEYFKTLQNARAITR